jgi:lipid A oxidase
MSKRFLMSSIAVLALGLGAAGAARAEIAISGYGGFSFSPDSTVTVNNGPTSWSRDIDWDGVSFGMPPYYGVRATYWLNSFEMPQWGVALDFNHNKVKARNRPAGVQVLEFTDGINYLTLNGLYRFQNETAFTPYVGVGAGLSIPHVEYKEAGGPKTFEYQLGGGVVAALAGVDYRFNDYISVFTEYRATYSWNDTKLKGGGSLDTNIMSHHLMLGLTVSFGK